MFCVTIWFLFNSNWWELAWWERMKPCADFTVGARLLLLSLQLAETCSKLKPNVDAAWLGIVGVVIVVFVVVVVVGGGGGGGGGGVAAYRSCFFLHSQQCSRFLFAFFKMIVSCFTLFVLKFQAWTSYLQCCFCLCHFCLHIPVIATLSHQKVHQKGCESAAVGFSLHQSIWMYSNFRRLHREWCFSRILLENDVDNILEFIEAWVNNKQSVSMAMGYQKAKDQKFGYSVF